MSKSPAYSWKMLRTDPIIATGQLFSSGGCCMRSSASSVPKLPQGMARMKNSRKPSEHGLRLFAPITCFVVKKRITSVPHRRSALPGSPLCRRPSRSKGAIPQGATCSFSSVSKRVFPRSESFRMTAPPKRYLLSGLRVIQLRKVGGGNLNQVAFNRSVSIFNAEHDVSLSL